MSATCGPCIVRCTASRADGYKRIQDVAVRRCACNILIYRLSMMNYSKFGSGLPPFQQGGLDSLCGLYSIINAERFINHSTDEETQRLFDDLIHYLARRKLLSKFLIGGIIHS